MSARATSLIVLFICCSLVAARRAPAIGNALVDGHDRSGPSSSLLRRQTSTESQSNSFLVRLTASGLQTGLLAITLLLVVILLAYTIGKDLNAKKRSASPSTGGPVRKVDVAIVGGGFGGSYVAYQMSKSVPHAKVVVFEKTDRIGGRLYEQDDVKLARKREGRAASERHHVFEELGGMRIFPSVQQKVAQAVKDAGCDLVPVPLTDKHNIFYYKKNRHEKGSFKATTSAGAKRSPPELGQLAIDNFKKQNPQTSDPYENAELRKMNLAEFLTKFAGANEEEINAFGVYSGYDLYPEDVTAALFVKDGELYGSALSSDQKYVKQGYQKVVQSMLTKSGAQVLMKHKVISVSYHDEEACHEVVVSDDTGHTVTWHARQVLISLPKDHMEQLAESLQISEARKQAFHKVQMLPLFKCFLEWDKPWWHQQQMKKESGFAARMSVQGGLECGKSTTDLDLRQVHYYDTADLLVYNSGPFAEKWNFRFKHHPPVAGPDGVWIPGAAGAAFEMLKELHDMPNMPEPNWAKTCWKFWPDGSHKWRVNANVNETIRLIATGHQDGSQVYICGDAFSSYQGWVSGVIETADLCLEGMTELYRMKGK